MAIFLDNAPFHRAKKVMSTFERLSIRPIFNAPQSPHFNIIELYWANLKVKIRYSIGRQLMTSQKVDTEKIIRNEINLFD